MFDFQWPWFVLLIPLPWVAWRFWPLKEKTGDDPIHAENVLLHPAVSRLGSAFTQAHSNIKFEKKFHIGLLLLLWLALVASLMQPQWLEKHTEIKSKGYDLMLAVDASRSMLALDFTYNNQRVNRLAVVKGVVGEFIKQRKGDRIGLILFGDGAYVQSALTLDGEVVRNMLNNVVPRIAGDGTAIGDAIGLAVKKLKERPIASRVLILLTDGENTSGSLSPLDAALLANQFNIRIYAIGVGSSGEVPFPSKNGQIKMEKMEIDETLLKQIAQKTEGAYFRATDTKALEEIYIKINSLEKTEAETKSVFVPKPLFRYPLAIAIMTLLLIAGLSLGRGGRW